MLVFGKSIPILMLARALQGTSSAFVWTVGLAMVLDAVGPGKSGGKQLVVWLAPRALSRTCGLIATQIFSFISVGELIAPALGGVLYDNAGYSGVFELGSGVNFIMRILLIEKKAATRYNSTLVNSAATSRYHSTENGDAEANDETDEEDALLPKTEEEEFKIPEGQNRLAHSLSILYCLYDPRLLTALLVAFVQATLLATFESRSQQRQRHSLASHR